MNLPITESTPPQYTRHASRPESGSDHAITSDVAACRQINERRALEESIETLRRARAL